MVVTVEKTVGGKKIPFLYAIRTAHLVCKELGITSIQDLVMRVSQPSLEDFAVIAWKGHENACFKLNITPSVSSLDEAFDLLDGLEISEAADLVTAFLSSIKGDAEGDAKKKGTAT
jgi:hypothetical protein